jgi:hypothetical protein
VTDWALLVMNSLGVLGVRWLCIASVPAALYSCLPHVQWHQLRLCFS